MNPLIQLKKTTRVFLVRSLLGAATASLLVFSSPAQAGYIVTLQQAGSNVVATGSGAIDLTGLTLFAPNAFGGQAEMVLAQGFILTGPASSVLGDGYAGSVVGPTSFGSGASFSLANSGSGDFVGFFFGMPVSTLIVPSGYISGSALSDSSTYDNATFSSLGVTPGTYVWTWGAGANQNFTLRNRSARRTGRGVDYWPADSRPGSFVFGPAGVAGPISLTIRRINCHLRTTFGIAQRRCGLDFLVDNALLCSSLGFS